MEVEFLKNFSKDLDAVSSKTIKTALKNVIEKLETVDSLNNFPNLKKLTGYKNTYRIRVGDYRLGFFFENNIISLARFVHRKDIYKEFP